jgi:hypothetical protein
MRVDQLLTSEYFGLYFTIDPQIEAEFNEYYRLLALRNRSQVQRQRLAELEKKLAPIDLPGTTRRERMLLKVIDKYLAEGERHADPSVRAALRGSTERTLARRIREV